MLSRQILIQYRRDAAFFGNETVSPFEPLPWEERMPTPSHLQPFSKSVYLRVLTYRFWIWTNYEYLQRYMLWITSPHFSTTMILEEEKIIKSMDKTRANITNTSSIITRALSLRILKNNAGSFFNHFVLKGICHGLQTPLLASLDTTFLLHTFHTLGKREA